MTTSSKDDAKFCAKISELFFQSLVHAKEIIPDIKVDIENFKTTSYDDCIKAVEKKNAQTSSSSDAPLKDLQVSFSVGGNNEPKVDLAVSLTSIANLLEGELDGEEVHTIGNDSYKINKIDTYVYV